jgi:hypothetical protein
MDFSIEKIIDALEKDVKSRKRINSIRKRIFYKY